MKRYLHILFLASLLIPALGGCNGTETQIQWNPVLALLEPQDGTQFQAGDLVVVKTGISSMNGVTRVDLMVNGQIIRSDALSLPLREGDITQGWYALAAGDHTLAVEGYTADGRKSSSKEIRIHVGSELIPTPEAEATRTPTPAPAAPVSPAAPDPPAPTAPPDAPTPLSPMGTIACAETTGGITLRWSAVSHPDGILAYEWEFTGGGATQSGSTTDSEAFIPFINCFENYTWTVRAVSNGGQAGPFSAPLSFTIN